MTTHTAPAPATTRYFGRCMVNGCKHRVVTDMTQRQFAYALNDERCPDHRAYPLNWASLNARHTEKVCGSRCMASTGPSCSCSCGGENHGVGHL